MAAAATGIPRRAGRWITVVLLLFLLPVGMSFAMRSVSPAKAANWWEARNDSSNQAPDPATTPEAVLQVYAARAFGWRGAVGSHTWFALKAAGEKHYTRVEVIGWGVDNGAQAVRFGGRVADGYWFGNYPDLLVDRRGPEAEVLIAKVIAAAKRYPYNDRYAVWPGPNSNTFTAFVARQVPELRLDLPPTAVGKDYLPNDDLLAKAPSGTGLQVSVAGLAGVMVAAEEGLEINLLGLTVGVDAWPPALKLPGVGRLGFGQ
jgi:hypothetical protein